MKVFLSWYASPPDPPYWLWVRSLDGIVVALHSLRRGVLDSVIVRGLKRSLGCGKTLVVDSLPFSLYSGARGFAEPLQSWVLYVQRMLGADILVHRDYPLVKASEGERERLLKRTILNAEHALKVAEKLGVNVMLVVQGWDIESYTRCAEHYKSLGAKYIGIGSLVPKKGNAEFLESVIKAIREVLSQNTYVHLFGVSSPRLALKLAKYVDSIDISTPIRAAAAREVIVEIGGRLKRVHISAIGEEQLHKMLEIVSLDLLEKFKNAKRLRDAVRAIAVYNAYVLINWLKKST